MIFLLLAAHDTTTSTLTSSIHYLSTDRDFYKELAVEARSISCTNISELKNGHLGEALFNEAMRKYIDDHPNWDQHRLMQAAISGYLLEKGVTSSEMRRFYTQSMFCKRSMSGSI